MRVPRPERRRQDDDVAHPVRPRQRDRGPGGGDRPRERRPGPRRLPSRPHRARRARARAARAGRRGDPDEALEKRGSGGDRRPEDRCVLVRHPPSLALAAALLAEPDVLLLDEPATGPRPARPACAAERSSARTPPTAAPCCSPATCSRRSPRPATASWSSPAAGASPRARSTRCSPNASACARPSPTSCSRRCATRGLEVEHGRPGTVIVADADPDPVGPRRPRHRRGPARDEHAGRARGALRRAHGGSMRTELFAAPDRRRLPAGARARHRVLRLPGDLLPRRARPGLDGAGRRRVGALVRRGDRVRGRRLRGGDRGRGDGPRRARARAARRRRPRRRSATASPPTRPRAHGSALAGALTAAVLTFGLLSAGGGPLPGADRRPRARAPARSSTAR